MLELWPTVGQAQLPPQGKRNRKLRYKIINCIIWGDSQWFEDWFWG